MSDLIFPLIVGFGLGFAQRHWWPQPWPWVWGKISSLWTTKPPAPLPPGG